VKFQKFENTLNHVTLTANDVKQAKEQLRACPKSILGRYSIYTYIIVILSIHGT